MKIMETKMKISLVPLAIATAFLGALPASAQKDGQNMSMMMSNGLMIPRMNASEGRVFFASKGCVVCHAINGVGGVDAPPLDAEYMDLPMNPFEFAARMWSGAEAMVELQRDELGDVIDLDGEELAAIIAFVHDADEQAKFSEADIPEEIEAMMGHMEEEEEGAHDDDEDDDGHD